MPALKVRSGGVLVPAKSVKVRWNGALVTAKAYWVKSGGVLVKVWTAFSVSPTSVPGYAAGPNLSGVVYSDPCTVSGSTNVAWTQVSGGAMTINSSTATSATWSATVTSGSPRTAVWRCTDNVTGATQDVTVTLTYDRNL